MAQTVVSIFLGADLRCQHDGLVKHAAKHGVRLDALGSGEHVVFVNSAKNKVKMYSPGGILSYLKLPRGTVDVRAIAAIPQTFGSGIEVKYRKSLAKLIRKELTKAE